MREEPRPPIAVVAFRALPMNPDTTDDDPLLRHYDDDHPWAGDPHYAEAVADPAVLMEIGEDVPFYAGLAQEARGPILDLCCGTGRIAIQIARLGHRVRGIDISATLLARFAERLAAEPPEVRERCRADRADARSFALDETFDLAVVGFNSLCMLPDRAGQMSALRRINHHLAPDGRVALDVVNPLLLPLAGAQVPVVVLSRTLADRGMSYTRWTTRRPMTERQTQVLEGWYDVVDRTGTLRREPFASTFKYVFRDEAELMLEMTGFRVEQVYGTYRSSPWAPLAPKIVLVARKVGAPLA